MAAQQSAVPRKLSLWDSVVGQGNGRVELGTGEDRRGEGRSDRAVRGLSDATRPTRDPHISRSAGLHPSFIWPRVFRRARLHEALLLQLRTNLCQIRGSSETHVADRVVANDTVASTGTRECVVVPLTLELTMFVSHAEQQGKDMSICGIKQSSNPRSRGRDATELSHAMTGQIRPRAQLGPQFCPREPSGGGTRDSPRRLAPGVLLSLSEDAVGPHRRLSSTSRESKSDHMREQRGSVAARLAVQVTAAC